MPGKSSRKRLYCLLAGIAFAAAGCGGGGSSSSSNNGGNNSPPGGNSGGTVTAPTVITLTAGQSASGTDINVPAPASSPAPNAQVLGVSSGSGGSAFNTGASIPRGSTMTVLMFGPGLSQNMQISISGPNDIGISNVQSIQSTTNTPGVSFQATVGGNAALGARTVILQNPQNDITTFTGGLEVTQ